MRQQLACTGEPGDGTEPRSERFPLHGQSSCPPGPADSGDPADAGVGTKEQIEMLGSCPEDPSAMGSLPPEPCAFAKRRRRINMLVGAALGALLSLTLLGAYVSAPYVLQLLGGSACGGGGSCWARCSPFASFKGLWRPNGLRWGRADPSYSWRRLADLGAVGLDGSQGGASDYRYDEDSATAGPVPAEADRQGRRKLQSFSYAGGISSSTSSDSEDGKADKPGPKLVIAGRMTVESGQCNVAEMNLENNDWSTKQRIQLSLYNSYSGGEVYSMLPNHTFPIGVGSGEGTIGSGIGSGGGAGMFGVKKGNIERKKAGHELILVGAFDTTYRNSQVTYCSVGRWDGEELSKVGEGLCNSALSRGMKITTAAMAGPQDVFVAGSFETQVWNGDSHEFVKIYNIAHYNAAEQVWMPLPVGQLTCSWCTVTVLSLAWDTKRQQLHVAGKFNAIDGHNIPAGLAIYDRGSGHLVAHPGGGLAMKNVTQDGVATSLQLDEERGVLYMMGSFDRLRGEMCAGLAAFEIETNHWTCLADAAHSVLPSGGGNMLLTPFGLMVAGKVTESTTWPDVDRPYTIALLKTTLKENVDEDDGTESSKDDKSDNDVDGGDEDDKSEHNDDTIHMMTGDTNSTGPLHDFEWSWLPGYDGWMEPIHTLANGFGDHEGVVFIGGDNLVAKWYYETKTKTVSGTSNTGSHHSANGRDLASTSQTTTTVSTPVTVDLSEGRVTGVIMAIAQLNPPDMNGLDYLTKRSSVVGLTIVVYCVALGAVFGMLLMLLCNDNVNSTITSYFFGRDANMKGISLDTLTYSAVENTNVAEAYQRAMRTRFVNHPHLLTLVDPQEIILHRIIGEGTFGRVWSARWRSSGVAVKEFVFAQAAVAGKSQQQNEIIEEIIGEAGMMAILRHPNVLQLFGCSLTAQAIWIVSDLCSLGSLRQLLDDPERKLSTRMRLGLALQVAEGMDYLHTQDPPIIHRDLKSHNILCHETFENIDTGKSQVRNKSKKSSSRSKSRSDGKQNSNHPGNGQTAPKISPGSVKMKSVSTINAKIGDWGSARATLAGSRTMTHGVGTACWLAPEVITHARSSRFSDVYGFGIILWELATREEVYQGLESTQIIARVANDNLRPTPPKDCPWANLMVQCWSENPKDRPSFDEVVVELGRVLEALPEELGEQSNSQRGVALNNSIAYSTYQGSK